MMETEQIKEMLRAKLKEDRYAHSLNTALTAQKLASYQDVDTDKAYLAGLVHDCAKDMSGDQLLNAAEEYDIPTDPIILRSPHLIHGAVGAFIARDQFEIHDTEILSAITHHTMGRENMTMLEKIIFLADLIEPSRAYEDVRKIRDIAYTDFEKAMLLAYNGIINFVLKKGDPLHPTTINARNYLIMH